VHLPEIVSDEWIKQLVAEQQVVIRSRRGFATRTEWRQLRPRNEALDCRTYARAAVWLAGADRWSDNRWHDLEQQLGLEAPPFNPVPLQRAIVTEQAIAVPTDPATRPPPIGGDIRRRLHAARRRVRW
jgi:phage terminase large subunit GpA-like protein